MSLTLYIGPMFAGKSSTVLGILRRNKIIGRNTLCLTSDLDKRYNSEGGFIVSHDKESHPAVPVTSLCPLITAPAFLDADCVLIEEAQFFPDLKVFVMEAVEVYSKDVIVVGLDGDSSRKPFGQVLDLIPFCDSIHKLTALCTKCGDGTPGLFSFRKATAASAEQVNVGTQDQYEPLCRRHYLDGLIQRQKKDHIAVALREKLSPTVELDRCMRLFGIDAGTTLFTEIVRKNITGL